MFGQLNKVDQASPDNLVFKYKSAKNRAEQTAFHTINQKLPQKQSSVVSNQNERQSFLGIIKNMCASLINAIFLCYGF